MIIGDFWQPFCVGKNNGGHKGRPRKTTFARLSLGGEVVRAADRPVMIWCPRHLREQSPFFTRAKKHKKNHWISWHCPFNTLTETCGTKAGFRYNGGHEHYYVTVCSVPWKPFWLYAQSAGLNGNDTWTVLTHVNFWIPSTTSNICSLFHATAEGWRLAESAGASLFLTQFSLCVDPQHRQSDLQLSQKSKEAHVCTTHS